MGISEALLWYSRHGLFKGARESAFRKFRRRNVGRSYEILTTDGVKMSLRIGASVENELFRHHAFEPCTTAVIRQLAQGSDSFVDIGCNIGYFSCVFQRAHPKARVIAVDANPGLMDRVRENLELNDSKDYELVHRGIGEERGVLTLNIPKVAHGQSSFAFVPRQGHMDGYEHIEVEVIPLSDLLAEKEVEHAFLKVDTEGFETAVFSSMNQELVERLPYIIFECFTQHFEKAGVKVSDLLHQAWVENYEAYAVDENEIFPLNLQEIDQKPLQLNVLLIRQDRFNNSEDPCHPLLSEYCKTKV